jgi:8-oxo-dGTP pyrophosphatase MutT (NUDIX family)
MGLPIVSRCHADDDNPGGGALAPVTLRALRPGSVNVKAVTDAMSGEPSRWRTFGERVIYDSPWVRLGQVDVELPGGERFWHHVVRLNRAAMMVLLDEENRVLLLWRHRFLPDRWGWEIPGGFVDADEAPAGAAMRELEEETGYRAGRVEPLIAFQPMVGQVDAEHLIFLGREPERIGDPTDASEAGRIEWVPLASVRQMIAAGEIGNAGSLVGLMRVLMSDGS